LTAQPGSSLILKMQETCAPWLSGLEQGRATPAPDSNIAAWLTKLAELMNLIRQGSQGKSAPLWRRLREVGVTERWKEAQSTRLRFEELSISDRTILLEDSYAVICNLGGDVTTEQQQFLRSGPLPPHPKVSRINSSHRKATTRHPQPKSSVVRMLMRLIRKLRGRYGS
jgi:hypothetical protein